MIKKMVMDEDRLKEVLGFAKIGLPEEEFPEVLERVNAVLRMCDDMQELDHDNVAPFEWDVKKLPVLRKDEAVVWNGRDEFLNKAPIKDGDFLRVPRIISLSADSSEDEFGED
ncbi:MAG: Asp-tRNA(Asn)/Glu-tRNA(Gln) amidotransferase subunit GatC [Synergistaceae bacterium]